MKLAYLAFTENGLRLAETLAATLGGQAERCNVPHSLSAWTEKKFAEQDGLVFVGAAGIAVRAIAPHLRHKSIDPAVVVVDEGGNFAIPILSGHLGGANALAKQIAAVCGAVPVITTATDVNGVFPVDVWAKRQGCVVAEPEKIKVISGRLLAGGSVRLKSRWQIAEEPPKGVILTEEPPFDLCVSLEKTEVDALHLIPKIAVLGIGCRKDTPAEKIEETFREFLRETHVAAQAISMVTSIDLKKEEKGLLAFCQAHGFPFRTYAAEELRQAEGTFTSSAFVAEVTGVDNVCERSAVLGSGGRLFQKKYRRDGVTMALALAPFAPDWRWQDA